MGQPYLSLCGALDLAILSCPTIEYNLSTNSQFILIHFCAVSAGTFRHIKRQIRCPDQGVPAVAMHRISGYADTAVYGGYYYVVYRGDICLRNILPDSICNCFCYIRIGIGKNDNEFIPSITCDNICFSNTF